MNTPDEDVLEVLKDANEWLSADGNDLNSTQSLRAAVKALNQYRTAQQTLADKRTECENLKRELSNLQRSPVRRNVTDRLPHVSVRHQILFSQRNCLYYEFTNFSLRPISYRGKMYPTSLHLYESFKFQKHRPDLAEHIRLRCSSPDDALLEARRFQSVMRSDWMNVNIQKMDETLWHKFTQHSDLKYQLFLTGDAELILDSNKDGFWGVGADRRGRNELGKALERLRTKLRGS
ncbi:hypothetical protein PILCRDRAFT_734998 [Piloderma croceum F 1598]|uniref:NADAR domain-containing protein n=1 Tax=Piloderma croceum (strain F 1598) TaxID=765440 RepID=A0A0C3AGQ1_PILCF|nr:hypothetical protein PILCRDRAFT_734998 [Piloderma croceum F 1598]